MEKTEQSCQKQISDGKKRKMASNSSDDRLSALPDCVLTHILSFLSTKLSVSTSILGKRWRFLWSQVPILDFNSHDYRKTETAMSKIINKIMMLHRATNIDTFRLFHHDDYCDFEFEAWIAALIYRNVRNLVIYQENQVKLPLCLFNCKTLVELSLTGWGWCTVIPMAGPVCLPALKKLNLDGVTYESLRHLVSGCPVVEELLVEMRSPESMEEEKVEVFCHIPSPTLNNLVLISEYMVVFNVKLDTPALKYLNLCDSMSDISAGALTSLIEADISFQGNEVFHDYALFSLSVIEFVGKLYNVKRLKLWTNELKVHSSAFSALTIKFYNLTKLELAADARFILRFLEIADNLQVLTILSVYGHLNWTDPEQVPACLASHLRKVRIHCEECNEQELSMMRYILRNAKVLEMMEIYSSLIIDKFQTLRRITSFQRGSEACQVIFF